MQHDSLDGAATSHIGDRSVSQTDTTTQNLFALWNRMFPLDIGLWAQYKQRLGPQHDGLGLAYLATLELL